MKIKILAEGGNLTPGPGLSQKLGPAGLNLNQVIQKVNEATSEFKGLKVPVELDVNPSTKTFEIMVFSPPSSELIKKELGIEKGSGTQAKVKIANVSIESVISVAKSKFPNMLAKNFKSAVKSIAGTCTSLGILIESKSPIEVQQEIDEGKYDSEINGEKTETSEEKKKILEEFFSEIKKKQEVVLKQEQAAKESETEKAQEKAPEKVEGKK
ncbi:50S ribosomal protein L11 [Candidatus Pacearchaeota archaeon CG10_big_fil_rev_8_21_14_0_10_34_12]|nr:MAG: 50S ribosomal protein L11 [Candidatus Pacearchaeota archaeon CG10_big_fil_rev_8_21_14_0_10_34_12]